jgi:hypothetical protein
LHGAIDEPKRRQFHQQVAEVMEARFTHLVETRPELLAEHFTEAGIIEKAIGYSLRAGLRSRDRTAWLYQHCRLGIPTQDAGDEQVRIAKEQGYLFWHATGTLSLLEVCCCRANWSKGFAFCKPGWKPTEPQEPNSRFPFT